MVVIVLIPHSKLIKKDLTKTELEVDITYKQLQPL